MTAIELKSLLRQKGVAIWADGDQLRYRAPVGVLTPELLAEFSRRKLELLQFLKIAGTVLPSVAPPVLRVPRNCNLPLSYAQERLWFLQQLDPGSTAYNIPLAVRIKGALHLLTLQRVLIEIIRRHEVLRTSFALDGERPVQIIHEAQPVNDEFVDLQDLEPEAGEEELKKIVRQETMEPFDLERDALIRIKLVQLAPNDHGLIFTMHHIASDAWSLGVMIREFGELYKAFSESRPSPLPELPVQYADYAVWQRTWLSGKVLEEQVSYWRKQLAGAPPVLELPLDRPRRPGRFLRSAAEGIQVPQKIVTSLRAFAQRENVTMFILFSAVFKVLLHRYSGQTDIVVGTPVANRNRAEVEGLIGFFANTLPLRSDLSGDPSFLEFLHREREVVLGAYAHQDVPFDHLVQELQVERRAGCNPVFQVVFISQGIVRDLLKINGLDLHPIPWEHSMTAFDLVFDVRETEAELRGTLVYSTDLFDQTTIRRLINHWERILEGVSIDPHRSLLDLDVLTGPVADDEGESAEGVAASFEEFARKLKEPGCDVMPKTR